MIRKRYGNDTERIGEKCSKETGWRGGSFSLQKLFEWVISFGLLMLCEKIASGFPLAKLEGYGPEKKS